MSRAMRYWKCMTCGSKAHHKGLCRECTTYDESGNIISPVPRERVDSKGKKYISQRVQRESLDLQMVKQKFLNNRRKKLTKKQRALAEKEAEALRIAQKELEGENDGDVVELGESVIDTSEEE